jgi:hypothetical protein
LTNLRALTLAVTTASLLAACGGGNNDSTAAAPAPAPAPAALTLAGVAAKGAALGGATVTAKCATGTGNATAATTGEYTLAITGGVLPCLLEAVSTDGLDRFHSVAAGDATATTATANITPLTELLVAQVLGSPPATFFADGASIATLSTVVTPAQVSTAQTAVIALLDAAGVDTTALTNLVSQPLVAAVGSTAGNGYDQVLDALAAQLTSTGTTLTTLTTTVAQSSPANPAATDPTAVTSAAVTLPAELLLRPAAANCSALRSGTYQMIKLAPSVNTADSAPVTAIETLRFDATTLTFNNVAVADTWQLIADGDCRFKTTNHVNDTVAVSQAGVIVARATIGVDDDTVAQTARGSIRTIIGIPVQNIPVSALAGRWNALDWTPRTVGGTSVWGAEAGTLEFSATGALTSGRCFDDPLITPEAACTVDAQPAAQLTVNAAGGFDLGTTDPTLTWRDRLFAYRPGNGNLLLLSIAPDGGFGFMTPVRAVTLPAVGTTRTSWNVYNGTTGVNSIAVDVSSWTAASVDAAAGTYVRNSFTVGQEANVQAQTVAINSGRTGYTRRLPGSGTYANGTAYTTREFFALGAGGSGLSAVALPQTNAPNPSNALFLLSVTQRVAP